MKAYVITVTARAGGVGGSKKFIATSTPKLEDAKVFGEQLGLEVDVVVSDAFDFAGPDPDGALSSVLESMAAQTTGRVAGVQIDPVRAKISDLERGQRMIETKLNQLIALQTGAARAASETVERTNQPDAEQEPADPRPPTSRTRSRLTREDMPHEHTNDSMRTVGPSARSEILEWDPKGGDDGNGGLVSRQLPKVGDTLRPASDRSDI